MHAPAHEIYLDCNATTPVLPAAADAALRTLKGQFGNPSSSHSTGLRAKALLDGVRARAARVLGTGAGQLLFVSGATEGIQTAVLSALCAVQARRAAGERVDGPILLGATEHKAVPQAIAHWNRLLGLNLPVLTVPVNAQGLHDLAFLQQHLPGATLLCTMAANNETGVVSDLAGIEAVLQGSGSRALWLVDCVQALGKLALNLAATRIDYAPFSGHKLYAPKGIGMLYVRAGSPYTALMAGGGQEGGSRAGTENMPGIAALGAVLEVLEAGGEGVFRSHAQLARDRARLADALRAAFPAVVFNMPFDGSLPTTLNFSVPGLESKTLLNVFDAAGMRISAGSACSAAKAEPSYVLQAMGLPEWQTVGAVRLSIGATVDDAFIDEACTRIARCGEVLQALAGERPTEAAAVQLQVQVEAGDAPDAHGVCAPALAAFFERHPHARLVDVRDVAEHQAGAHLLPWRDALPAAPTLNLPLDTLRHTMPADTSAEVLQSFGPVLMFCRSGARSRQAAAWLRERGHTQVWHLEGGLALAEMA
ncbi:aminotransferase class V-fold PLP-dependent enzyme [Rhodoferax bucti]|uniref:aminotransferase class V-fold PLP-dependent enzyme n=1 Tax=Rhodoferax bucti TaxID=2576305 RepID=UPI001108DC50|nr:aminotransferase class V-fold PLP-dependent enzyme [Rhodoferax bucti]